MCLWPVNYMEPQKELNPVIYSKTDGSTGHILSEINQTQRCITCSLSFVEIIENFT